MAFSLLHIYSFTALYYNFMLPKWGNTKSRGLHCTFAPLEASALHLLALDPLAQMAFKNAHVLRFVGGKSGIDVNALEDEEADTKDDLSVQFEVGWSVDTLLSLSCQIPILDPERRQARSSSFRSKEKT